MNLSHISSVNPTPLGDKLLAMDTSHQLSTGKDVSMSRILSTLWKDEANKSKEADDDDASTATPVANKSRTRQNIINCSSGTESYSSPGPASRSTPFLPMTL
jgi:hypothetical protein